MIQDADNQTKLFNANNRIEKAKQKEDRERGGEMSAAPVDSTGTSTAVSVGNAEADDSKPIAMDTSTDDKIETTVKEESTEDAEESENASENEKQERTNNDNEASEKPNNDSMKANTNDIKADPEKDNSKVKDDATMNVESAQSASSASTKQGVNGSTAAASPPPPPVLKGTLSYNIETRRHMIRGMWNYENSNALPPQRFELLRNLDKDEEVNVLPKDGEFHGSFSLAYFHTTSKGKQKERSKVIMESGVKIKFTTVEGKEGEFNVDGEGTNQFGVFNINGTATPSEHEDDPTYDIVLRKRYKPTQLPAGAAATENSKKVKKPKKRKISVLGLDIPGDANFAGETNDGPLPPPSESFPSRVVCLRGKLSPDESEELGVPEVVHRINGMWSSGLDLILADPQNVRGLCNRFEYEHKSSTPNKTFPISGRYSGWFDLSNEDGSRTRITEKDITLKFRKNNAGYHNIEGKGSNAFGKYSITGTLTQDSVLTIFRHFQPRKTKTQGVATKAPVTSSASSTQGKAAAPVPEPKISLDEVIIPDGDKKDGNLESIPPPQHGTYSALMRGIIRLNDDGAHTCSGKWAMTREHFNNGTVSNFSFRLEPHFAAQGAAAMKKANGESPDEDESGSNRVSLSTAPPGSMTFPVDSAMYKGSFQMKRAGTKYTSVIDQQIALKFRENSEGSYNVYGRGINSIGIFNLLGKLISSGKSSGHVEVYRMYPLPPPSDESAQTAKPEVASKTPPSAPVLPKSQPTKIPSEVSATQDSQTNSKPVLARRGSARPTKLPSRLEDDDPSAQINRLVDKCGQVLKIIREKDVASGAFFGQPVDPVAHGIPTYYQIIKQPMDLGTLQSKIDANEIESPEEFGRLVRLVFDNAMTFNVDATHVVHQSARQLLILFNQKFRDIERMCENIRRQHKIPAPSDGEKEGKGGKGKKRKGSSDENKSAKRMRLEEAQAMAATNTSAVAALVAAAPSSPSEGVTRTEFNMMLQLIQQLQGQLVQTHTLLANMSPDTVDQEASPIAVGETSSVGIPAITPLPEPALPLFPEKRKAMKREEKPAPMINEDKPLSFEEQQQLTDTINNLPPDKLPGVINIIRESGSFGDDEEEIDLEIDALDTVTQRKLQRFVAKHVKPPRRQRGKQPGAKKAKKSEPKPKPTPAIPKKQQQTPQAKPAGEESFFAFGGKDDDSDSGSDGEVKPPEEKQPASTEKDFNLGDGFGDAQENDSDDNEDLGNGGFGANWSMSASKPTVAKKDTEDEDEDDWGAAREQAKVSKEKDAERKAREAKLRAEAEQAKNQRLADAAARGEEVRAQREEEAAIEARLREQKEKKAEEKKKAARDAAKAELEDVKQTIYMDEQRDIMQQFENKYIGDEAEGASPSSDFGF
mmetsp:Transcript_23713/g.35875  ORF Transcript_23713/g.35875 Transcript_23713/m.35875 type:complete len:1380 (+) Transcript_23713:62-4201(+)